MAQNKQRPQALARAQFTLLDGNLAEIFLASNSLSQLRVRGSIAYTRPTGGAFHCLVQFTATLDPSEMTSLFVRGFPGERSELTEGYRSFGSLPQIQPWRAKERLVSDILP